jgi:hypothetical protein
MVRGVTSLTGHDGLEIPPLKKYFEVLEIRTDLNPLDNE